MNSSDRASDTRRFQERRNLAVTNANLFIANNNNPFLISPYSPPTNIARQSQITDINDLISSVEGNLATVIDLTTWTLRINTITNGPISNTVQIVAPDILLDATVGDVVIEAVDIVRLSGNEIDLNAVTTTRINGGTDVNITAPTINMLGSVYFPGNTYFNNISTNILNASVAGISSLTVSTVTVGNLVVNNMTVRSTLNASTTNTNYISTGVIFADFGSISTLNASTLTSSEIETNYLTVFSTLTASTTNTNSVSTNLLFADVGSISTLNTSTVMSSEIDTNYLTVNNILNASTTNTNSVSTGILNAGAGSINSLAVTTLNAAGNITFQTMTGSNISVLTMTVHSTLTVSSINATGHISFQTMSGNTIGVVNYGNFQTMGVSTGTISSFTFSSISMEPNSLSSGTGTTFTSSIIIFVQGIPYKIPLEKI
jgi:hypothetical protein